MMTCKDCIHFDACMEMTLHEEEKFIELNFATSCELFKDKSRMVELPVKTGETVYVFHNDNILECIIDDVNYRERDCLCKIDPTISYWVISTETDFEGDAVLYDCFYPDNIGETVFLTKSEAENALAKKHQK